MLFNFNLVFFLSFSTNFWLFFRHFGIIFPLIYFFGFLPTIFYLFFVFLFPLFLCADPKNWVTTKLNHCFTMNTRLTTRERMVQHFQHHHRRRSSATKKSRIHYLKSVNASYSLYAPTTFIKIVSLFL